MVCLRNISSLLLALAAFGAATANPMVEGQALAIRQGSPLSGLLGGGNDDSSSKGSSSPTGSGSGSGSSPASATASPTQASSPSSSPSNSPSASPTDSPTSKPASATPSAGPTTQSAAPTTMQTSPSPEKQSTTAPVVQTSSPSPTPLSTLLSTDASGQVQTVVKVNTIFTSGSSVYTGAAYTTPTSAPSTDSTSADDKSKSGSGLSTGAIVGIVVGTVGGVILIAALAAVGWRVWGKNRNRGDEDDVLMGDGVYGTSEIKSTSGGSTMASSPFSNNLEQYHAPGRANPSANF